ncbi:M23 family metallopeptidase [Streptomyces roseicoloratus]|uniref:M23 family metallopeptidase n=1 Tax=Streptomyces roseicoloratus TaxID=2508722 RepID=UPI001009934B|nr:M23 family metallopeptidase [Streptomyces roseicoloratus]
MSVRRSPRRVRRIAGLVHRALWLLFLVQTLVSFAVDLPYPYVVGWLPAAAAGVLGLGLGLTRRKQIRALPERAPVEVLPPVTGRWSALNSPADRVPSHGTHQYAQTHAIDITAESDERPRPAPALIWPLVRRGTAFPAFGAPVRAVAAGTVTSAEDGLRDHLSRTSLPAVLYMLFVESGVRALFGARLVTGNHLVLDLGDGTYAMYGHLRRGSLTVRPGDRVTAGQVLADCGNSGSSSEPHVHFQLMDGPDADTALGVPFTWSGVGVPRNGETFEVPLPGAEGVATTAGGRSARLTA